MKKIVQALTILSLVMVSVSCSGAFVSGFKDGVAWSGAGDSRPIVDMHIGDGTQRECAIACEEIGGTVNWFVVTGSGMNVCKCNGPLAVIPLGNASSAGECSKMAGEAKYLRYIYNDKTNSCGGRGPYSYIGNAETKKECSELVKTAGKKKPHWDMDSKKCVAELPLSEAPSAAMQPTPVSAPIVEPEPAEGSVPGFVAVEPEPEKLAESVPPPPPTAPTAEVASVPAPAPPPAAPAVTFETANVELLPLIGELQERDGIYYDPATSRPFTGVVNPSNCRECGWRGKAEIKDGKFHGRYADKHEEGGSKGYYKDGKRDGEWTITVQEMDSEPVVTVEVYKDGVLQK